MNPIVVGQNPSYKTDNNQSLGRLARWMRSAGLEHWSFVNVQDRPGSFVPSPADRHFLWSCLRGAGQPIIALGWNASRTLERLQIKHTRIDHPSGLNRNLNDPKHEAFVVLQIKSAVCGKYVGFDSRDPDPSRQGIFRDHNCWKCNSGEKPCVVGSPYRCDYPHTRND